MEAWLIYELSMKVVRAHENVEKPERCPVKLYKKYISTFEDIW